MVRQLSALLAGKVSGGQACRRHAGLGGVGRPAAEPLAHGDRQVPPPGDDLLGDGASYLSPGTRYGRRAAHALGKGTSLMTNGQDQPAAVSRRICAPAHDIFQVLADPVRHPDFDGSEMLRGASSAAVISGVGDVFVLTMHVARIGECEMNNHVGRAGPADRLGTRSRARASATAPGSSEPARRGHRWSYQLFHGPAAIVVTEIYDCSRRRKTSAPGCSTCIWTAFRPNGAS
jgi:hypothetical protein